MYGLDSAYRTKTVPSWVRSPAGPALGCIIASLGVIAIAFSITNLVRGRATMDLTLPSNSFPQLIGTWTGNPFWPSAGKGIWVGLLLLVTGIMGCVSFADGTLAALKAFLVLTAISLIFSFYLMITSIIPLSFLNGNNATDTFADRNNAGNNIYVFNSVLIAVGLIATLILCCALLIALAFAGYCTNYRTRTRRNTPLRPRIGYPPIGRPGVPIAPRFGPRF
ncbi:hypothetical protein ACOME3_006189 [Neoechinorhynchus agilis]